MRMSDENIERRFEYEKFGSVDMSAEYERDELVKEIQTQEQELCDKDDKIRELANENENLKAQVYNLTLYLKVLWDNCNTAEFKGFASQMFDGMPGYGKFTEAILDADND